jgi:hypothetical protein
MIAGLAAKHFEAKTMMIEAAFLKAYRAASRLNVKNRGRRRLIDRKNGGINTQLHAICDIKVRPLTLLVTARQVSVYIGLRALQSGLPQVDSSL